MRLCLNKIKGNRMFYLLVISVVFMLTGITYMVSMYFLSEENDMAAYVILILGIIGFGYSVLSVVNKVNTLKEENKILVKQKEALIGYYVDNNCSDREVKEKE